MVNSVQNSHISNNAALINYPPPDSGRNLDAHYTDNIKVKRPAIVANSADIKINAKPVYTDRDATLKIQKLNTDIYEGQQKEKSSHEFNFKTYCKIFAGIIIAAAGIAGIRAIIRHFKK